MELTLKISCPKCSQGLRVPNRLILVTCPTCKHNFQQEPCTEVLFKCAKTGEPFVCFLKNGVLFQTVKAVTGTVGAATTKTPNTATIDIKDTDFTGWYCPYCEWNKDGTKSSQYLQCGKCSSLVCFSTVVEKNNEETFHCFCGRVGIVSGTLKSLDIKGNPHELPGDDTFLLS